MSGNNQAMRLQGMLGDLANSFNGMGDAYNYIPDAIRNVTRPSVETDDSASLYQMAQWAERNGFEDKARQYMTLAFQQKQKEIALEKENIQIDAQGKISQHIRNIQSIKTNPAITDESVRRQLIQAEQDAINVLAKEGKLDSTDFANVGGAALEEASKRYISTNYNKEMNKLTNNADNLYNAMQRWDPKSPEYAHLSTAYENTLQKMNNLSQAGRGGDGSRAGDLFVASKRANELVESQEQRAVNAESRAAQAEIRAQAVAERQEAIAPYQLQSAVNKVITERYTITTKAEEDRGGQIAQGLIRQGITSPNAIPKDLSPVAYAEAEKRLNDHRESLLAQAEASKNGTLSPFMMQKAKQYAPYVPDLQVWLDQYSQLQEKGAPVTNVERRRVVAGILAEVKKREEYMSTAGGNLKYAAGAALKGLADLDDNSGMFEDATIKSLLAKAEQQPELFNSMRGALAEYMEGNNIQSFNNVTELYAAINAVLPTLSEGAWHQAFSQIEQQRDAYKEQFFNHADTQKQAYVDYSYRELAKSDSSYLNFPEETKAMLEDEFERTVRDISRFMDMATELPRSAPVESVGAQNGRAFGGGQALTHQQRMMLDNSNEWSAVVEMVGEDNAEIIRDKVMAGYPITYADLDLDPKEKGVQMRTYR